MWFSVGIFRLHDPKDNLYPLVSISIMKQLKSSGYVEFLNLLREFQRIET